jgi:mannose-1-phosphate guanylyltransferase
MAAGYQSKRAAVILAGGDGTRLRAFTSELFGEEIPKQFCPLWGEDALLAQTRRRAALLIEPAHTVTVFTAAHARFYQPLMADMSGEQVAVQPLIRGTAPAILYALMRLKKIAPDCAVAMFPSDHFVGDDRAFMRHVEAAFRAVDARPEATVLLGIKPADPQPEYGWIEPGELLANECEPVRHVRRFWEKPPPGLAQPLMRAGCLWNSFVIVARLSTFLGLFLIALPDLYQAFIAIEAELGTPSEETRVRRLYGRIAPANFSREVLAKCPFNLAVLPVNGVEWSDLGESGRVVKLLANRGIHLRCSPALMDRPVPAVEGEGSANDL